jgi:hypothetical protein
VACDIRHRALGDKQRHPEHAGIQAYGSVEIARDERKIVAATPVGLFRGKVGHMLLLFMGRTSPYSMQK